MNRDTIAYVGPESRALVSIRECLIAGNLKLNLVCYERGSDFVTANHDGLLGFFAYHQSAEQLQKLAHPLPWAFIGHLNADQVPGEHFTELCQVFPEEPLPSELVLLCIKQMQAKQQTTRQAAICEQKIATLEAGITAMSEADQALVFIADEDQLLLYFNDQYDQYIQSQFGIGLCLGFCLKDMPYPSEYQRRFATNHQRVISGERLRFTNSYLDSAGTREWFQIEMSPLVWSEGHSLSGKAVVVVAKDVTANKEAELEQEWLMVTNFRQASKQRQYLWRAQQVANHLNKHLIYLQGLGLPPESINEGLQTLEIWHNELNHLICQPENSFNEGKVSLSAWINAAKQSWKTKSRYNSLVVEVLAPKQIPIVHFQYGTIYKRILDKVLQYWASLERHMEVDIQLTLLPGLILQCELKATLSLSSDPVLNQVDELAPKALLAEVEEMCNALDLKIETETKEITNQRVLLQFPCTDQDPASQQNQSLPLKEISLPETQFTILIADDNPINLTVLKQVLSKWAVKTILVDNGQKAVNAILENKVDLVLMDLHMPDMDGFEASKLIRSMDATKAEVPIIAFTGDDWDGVAEQLQEAGIVDYLPKPYRLPELEAMILKYLPEAKGPTT